MLYKFLSFYLHWEGFPPIALLSRGEGIAGTCYGVEITSTKVHWQLLLLTQLITKFLCLKREGQNIAKQTQILLDYHEDDNLVKNLMIAEILKLFQHWLGK